MKRKVVLTGASGVIARLIIPVLRERYDLLPLDMRTTDPDGKEVEGIVLTDLSNRDRNAYRDYFRGADAVVHSAFIQNPETKERFWDELENVAIAYNVYQTCIEENVRRLVVMSSNHAADYYERLIWSNREDYVTPDMAPWTDNYYGWGKVAYEQLGFVFATGNVTDGKRLQNVQLRIGAPRETDLNSCEPGDLKKMHRALGAYISVRDFEQLLVKSIETENIEDPHGIPFQIFYGISDNRHNFWSIRNAREVIGYTPEDDSQVRFLDKIVELTSAVRKRQK